MKLHYFDSSGRGHADLSNVLHWDMCSDEDGMPSFPGFDLVGWWWLAIISHQRETILMAICKIFMYLKSFSPLFSEWQLNMNSQPFKVAIMQTYIIKQITGDLEIHIRFELIAIWFQYWTIGGIILFGHAK